MAHLLSLRTRTDVQMDIDMDRLVSVVAYKKDLFRPQLINLLFVGDGFERELAEITPDQGIMITQALSGIGLAVVPFDRWWEQVTDPLLRQGDIPVFPAPLA